MPPVCCWAWTQKALFTIFFVFFQQSCTVTALSSNMHLVLSHRCVRTIWSVWKPPGLMLNRKGQWICPLSGFRVKSLSFLGVDRFPFSCPTQLPLSRNSICLSPWKAATGSAGKLEAAFHCSPNPDPTQLQRELWCSRHVTCWEEWPTQPTKTHQAAAEKVGPHMSIQKKIHDWI